MTPLCLFSLGTHHQQGRVFVHQRSDHKRVFPSMYDMFVGGVSQFGEETCITAQRELQEELGLGKGPFTFLYSCLIETGLNRCFVDVYDYTVQEDQEEVQIDHDEVQWGDYMSLEEVKRRVDEEKVSRDTSNDSGSGKKIWRFVPDGLLVWDALLEYWEDHK